MTIIEPCCCQKQLCHLRDTIASGGTKEIRGYGDMSLTELLPALLTRYAETRLLIMAPSLPDQAAEVISRWMRRQWGRADGRGKVDVISSLTLITDLDQEVSPIVSGWRKGCEFTERLTLVDKKQKGTVILLPDIAFIGPVNMRYGRDFTAVVTTEGNRVKELWENLGPKNEPKDSGSENEPKIVGSESEPDDAPAEVQTPNHEPPTFEESQGEMKEEEKKEPIAPEVSRPRSRRKR